MTTLQIILIKNIKKFLNTNILDNHVAYDIGAKSLTLCLSKKLKQSYIFSNFSRLLIDPNRKKSDKDLIVSNTFDIQIPINKTLEKRKDLRVKNFYNIYHGKISELIKNKVKKYEKVFLISIHSFTKKNKTFNRGIEVGLLWNKNMNLLCIFKKDYQTLEFTTVGIIHTLVFIIIILWINILKMG